MDFEPLNADHSIDSVKVAIFLDRMIIPADIERAQERHDNIRSELPAFIRISDEGAGAFEFAYMRPDASSAWALRFEDDRVTVECNRYTRWSKIWETFSAYLAFALSTLQEDPVKIEGVSLSFVDKFKANKSDHDIKTLLKPSKYLPTHTFERDYVWHVHTGWLKFEEISQKDQAVSNFLRVECYLDERKTAADSSEDLLFAVSVVHTQRVTYREFLNPDVNGMHILDAAVQRMHAANKAALKAFLADDMLAVIGLGSE